ncbi:MAG: DNA cytosine methyltransferase [Desulfobacterales bacterium]|nr:DNA cytosine methyltransferase [Desulfobacterales bacterium]
MFNAIDLFSGCGGLSEGLKQAGFKVIAGVEIDNNAVKAYRMNHADTVLFESDIRKLDTGKVLKLLKGNPLHLLAGCPPCQGFSSIRRLNRKSAVCDERNSLIDEYYRFVEELNPLTIMLENVPGIIDYILFIEIVRKLKILGYNINYKIVDVADYSVPQRRKRLVLVGSKMGKINIASGINTPTSVRDVIGKLKKNLNDELHKIYPKHTEYIQKMISLIPKNGGSRKDLPEHYELECHKKKNVGFNDVYGRLRWDTVSSTITGGCLNPSKGRFLHPKEDRCISAREAALLQTFPIDYKFPTDIPRAELALLIGNALPPEFSRIQAENIFHHIEECYD